MRLPDYMRAPSLRETMRRLRRHAPLCAPVRLRKGVRLRCNGKLCLAVTNCYRTDGKVSHFTIWMDRRSSLNEQTEYLLHEWAHALDNATRRTTGRNCHDTRWGQCYAKAWNASRNTD